MASLHELTGADLKLQDMLLDPDADPDVLNDTLEAVRTAKGEKLDAYADIRANYRADANALGAEIKRLQDRKKALTNAADRMTEAMLVAVQAQGGRAKSTRYTYFTRKSVRVDLVNPAEIPIAYLNPPMPNKKAIGDDLKAGKDVPGTALVRGVGLGIK